MKVKKKIQTGKDKIVTAISLLLKDIKLNFISKEHRHAEINLDCAECRMRILEGYLEWYKGQLPPTKVEGL